MPSFKRSAFECFLLLIHVPPGLFQTFVMVDMFDTPVTYSVRVCNVIVFFRLIRGVLMCVQAKLPAVFFRDNLSMYVKAASPFDSVTAQTVRVLYGYQPSHMTPLKKVIADRPIPVLFCAFMSTLSVFAYFVAIFERPGQNRSGYPSTILGYKHIYDQTWWCVHSF